MNKKIVMLISLMVLVVTAVFANSNTETATSEERVKMVIALDKMPEGIKLQQALDEVVAMDKYSHVDFEIRPSEADFNTTLPIAIAAGEQRDLVALANPIIQATWSEEGILLPLDEYIDELGVDYNHMFGNYAEKAKFFGNYYTVPHEITKWVLYYNKKHFDNAGIPYPSTTEPMTWDEYTEIAAKLTTGEGSEKVYGALHLTWPMYWYGEAIQTLGGGEMFYNEDGLSNIEDPAFRKALERNFKMQHVDKSVPSQAEIVTSKIGPQAFMNGQYGMVIGGGWYMSWARLQDKYGNANDFPRDWDMGVAPLPVPAAKPQPSSWGIVNGIGIPQTSADPKLALEIALDLMRLSTIYAESAPEAYQLEESPVIYDGMGADLQAEGMDAPTIKTVLANPETLVLTEKVTGPNNVAYEKVIKEEVEKYFVEAQDLDTTINNIKKRGDKAIMDK